MAMKQKGLELLLALVLGFGLPCLMLNSISLWIEPLPTELPIQSVPTAAQEIVTQEEAVTREEIQIRVLTGDTQQQMDLEEYLIGVVLGEMPASFEVEALKAQAVVARTYTLRRVTQSPKHPGSAVCTSPDCCQAYTAPESYDGGQESLEKVAAAVEATAGQVLTYQGALIEATYFASSGGYTEDALVVWGSDLPYLQATSSPEDAYADKYMNQVTMTTGEFQKALGLSLSGDGGNWIRSLSYTNGGGVAEMNIGGTMFRGTELRQLLGLKSTAFTISISGDMVTITTRGHGHRVGMSQYGAEAMAVAGSSYEEILLHYYQGVHLEEYIDNSGDIG